DRAGGCRPGAAAGHGADAGPRRHHDRRGAGAGHGWDPGLGRDPAPFIPGPRGRDPPRAPGRSRARARVRTGPLRCRAGSTGGGSYHEYLVGGMLAMGLAMTAPGTAVALVTDMSSGLIDRFRSLPTARSAVLAGRTIADLVTQVIGAVVVAGIGLAIGWRIHS